MGELTTAQSEQMIPDQTRNQSFTVGMRSGVRQTEEGRHRGPELVWATGRLMSPEPGFGKSCLLHCDHLRVSANLEDS